MDDVTHLVITYKLLESCGCDKRATIYSLLPALDRKPPHFHRVYGHIISNFPKILETAIHVFANDNASVDKNAYEYVRINEDKDSVLNFAQVASNLIGDKSICNPSSDKVSSGVALLSHIYFDTYNNPVQAFLPDSVYSSGQWNFWRDVGYLTFRTKFYEENVISAFRKNLFSDEIWNTKIDPYTLIKAMIIRLGDLSRPGVEYEIVDWKIRVYLRFLGCDEYRKPDEGLKFCKELENKITNLIYQCLKAS